MRRSRLLGSTSFDATMPLGQLVDITMRVLATSGPTATGATLIMPDGSVRYFSKADADKHVAPPSSEARQ